MQTCISSRLGHELVVLRAEGRADLEAAAQTDELIRRMDAELRGLGLSLADTVRTRLWARDRASRDQGSRARVGALSGSARSASSSFIAPDVFDSDALIAIELWAMRPSRPGQVKTLVEYDPPIVPLRYLVYDSAVFLSGVTSVLPGLPGQVEEILAGISGTLAHARVGWEHVSGISCILHRGESLDSLRSLLAARAAAAVPTEFSFADGYSTEGKLIEIEVTAKLA
ncbi:MAG: hypothetical protein QOF51_3103 [Chloroflexota bacterium]|nr:hypothetical protein [Chloroflexota bacterium]